MAQPGHLQKWQGYPRIGLEVRIPKIPIFPVFHIRFSHKSGKTGFPFCFIVTQLRHLQSWVGYPRIRLDLRIPTIPIFPVFRIWFGPKSGKTAKKTRKMIFPFGIILAQPGHLCNWERYPWIGLVIRIQTVPIFPVFLIPFGRKSGKTAENGFSVLHYCGSTRAPTDLNRVPADRA